MPKIHVLPKEVYQLIAAGEVVERPSSVIKEMVENSIDAGAANITVEIKNGGSTYMRITDDGCGIDSEDVRNVFVSHATSKIETQQDLDAIGTLGFRGEAMASIGAVARVELLTRTHGFELGTRYVIAGGEEQEMDQAGCPEGTTIVVRDLFFNTPARMKFLKKDVTEGNAVAAVLDSAAISHPEISFRFIRDGKQVMITSGNGDLKSAVYSVFGKELSEALMPVDYSFQGMRVSGFVSKPHASRKSRAMQYFFINGRMVKSKTAMAALEQAYKNCIMVGRFPACVLHIEMNTALVDVNVHPAKIEVRFVNERPVFDLIYYGVKSAIENGDTVKEAAFNNRAEQIYSSVMGQSGSSFSSKADFFKRKDESVQTKFVQKPRADFWQVASVNAHYDTENGSKSDDGAVLHSNFKDKSAETEKHESNSFTRENDFQTHIADSDKPAQPEQDVIVEDEDKAAPDFRVIGEAFKTYILVEIEQDIYCIDKHAAHERMNFENLKKNSEINSQILLSPVSVRLAKQEFSVICENLDLLRKCGFEVEEFGSDSIIVRAVPSMLDSADISDLICEIADKLLSHKTDIEPEKLDWIFHSTACRAAVKAGDCTSPQEMEIFVGKLLSMPDIRYCPHGRPVMIKISRYELEKQFGRV